MKVSGKTWRVLSRSATCCAILAMSGALAAASAPATTEPQATAAAGDRTVGERGLQILLLGTAGGPGLTPRRAQSALIISVDGRRYLFDCGTGTVRQMALAGIAPGSIHEVFITHHHPDHNLDLVTLMGNAEFEAIMRHKPASMTVYGPIGTVAMVKAAREVLAVSFRAFAAQGFAAPTTKEPAFRVKEIGEGSIFNDGLISVSALENSHYALMPADARASLKSFSFRIATPYGDVVITGDTGPDARLTAFAKGARVLISEAVDVAKMTALLDRQVADGTLTPSGLAGRKAHMTTQHLDLPLIGDLAREAGVAAVVLTHLGPETDDDTAAQIGNKVAARFNGQVVVGDDFMRLCMSTTGGSRLFACAREP